MQFEALYDKYADKLYRLALTNLGSTHDAEDIVHDVFIKYFEVQPHFEGENHREGWLVKVTVNACRDFLRKKAHRNHHNIDDMHHIKSEEKEESDIMYSLSLVPERYRMVLVLHYLEGYTVNEVSRLLNLSVSAVKMRLSRGREILKTVIEKEEYGAK
jgi:RNA polymerase sigma-70 factor (ECF subfamily)